MDFNLFKEQLIFSNGQGVCGKISALSRQGGQENKIPEEILKGLAELDLFGILMRRNMASRRGYDGTYWLWSNRRACSGWL
jgi:hypothetical protein